MQGGGRGQPDTGCQMGSRRATTGSTWCRPRRPHIRPRPGRCSDGPSFVCHPWRNRSCGSGRGGLSVNASANTRATTGRHGAARTSRLSCEPLGKQHFDTGRHGPSWPDHMSGGWAAFLIRSRVSFRWDLPPASSEHERTAATRIDAPPATYQESGRRSRSTGLRPRRSTSRRAARSSSSPPSTEAPRSSDSHTRSRERRTRALRGRRRTQSTPRTSAELPTRRHDSRGDKSALRNRVLSRPRRCIRSRSGTPGRRGR